MTDHNQSSADSGPVKNTDREIYHTPFNSVHDDSIHVTQGGGIGINVAGNVIVKPLRGWHALASIPTDAQPVAWSTPIQSGRQLTSQKDVADRWLENGHRVDPLYLASQPSPAASAQRSDWQTSNWEEAKASNRILLVWKAAGGFADHVELGMWLAAQGAWTNTYGKPFSGDPDGWSPLKPFDEPLSRSSAGNETELLATLVYEAMRFAIWAAGQGMMPDEGEPALGPEDFLYEYSCALEIDDWEGLAEVARDHIRAVPQTSGVPEAVRLLTKITDLIDDEDAGEPLDDAIRWANEALAALSLTRPESK